MELYESTQTESNHRVAKLLPTTGSENVFDSIKIKQTAQIADEETSTNNFIPNEKIEWVVNISLGNPTSKDEIITAISKQWREEHFTPTIYGFNNSNKSWTYIFANDTHNNEFTELKLAWKLVDDIREEHPLLTEKDLESILHDLKKIRTLKKATISPVDSPSNAGRRADELSKLKSECDFDAIIVLDSDGPLFDGENIWDVMLSLGLRWGDMDLFHYENQNALEGDDHIFSVWTLTEPGYFLPEVIADGKVKVDNLIFGFKVPRIERPIDVTKSMHSAAIYCQKRLGGKLLSAEGNPLVENDLLEQVEKVNKSLLEAGFRPGATESLLLF